MKSPRAASAARVLFQRPSASRTRSGGSLPWVGSSSAAIESGIGSSDTCSRNRAMRSDSLIDALRLSIARARSSRSSRARSWFVAPQNEHAASPPAIAAPSGAPHASHASTRTS